ncbi:MAG TPA: UDP-glucose/GDP-mannose dehydrogenase family protein [Bradyrhizobium sp.]|nr:UDP-glucose/GDP-mannose dehydrogenase family protein [Bradyrhizobium sp.]
MKITIVGTGYVGLVTGVGLAAVGHTVTCVDRDKRKIEVIERSSAPFYEPGLDELLVEQRAAGRLLASTNLEDSLRGSDVSIIAVGTPSNETGIDLSYIRQAAQDIGSQLPTIGTYHVVVVKSTVVPTTTDTVVRGELEAASGMVSGRDFGLAMNPEFLSEGRAVEDFTKPDRIVIGASTARAGAILADVYAKFNCPILQTTPRNAEMVKYAANALQATLISFSNEIAGICETVSGLDEGTVMRGVHLDKCWGAPNGDGKSRFAGAVTYLRAGIGFGGSCFPKDLRALRAFALNQGAEVPILSSVLKINEERAGRVVDLLASHFGVLRDKRIAVLGLAFKPETDDVRESPGVRISKLLLRRSAEVVVHDPLVRIDAVRDQLGTGVTQAPDVATAASGADAIVIATGWDAYRQLDWADITSRMRSPVIFDGRQVMSANHLDDGTTVLAPGQRPERVSATIANRRTIDAAMALQGSGT